VDACESVKELLKAKLIDVRAKLEELRHLESELETDLRMCIRELNHRRRHAACACPVLEEVAGVSTMKIEILYVPGCPHQQPAFERLAKVLASESLSAEISQVAVNTEGEAKTLLLPGSPTIRIKGKDVEPAQNAPGLACRLYSNLSGVPSERTLRLAITATRKRERHGSEKTI